jgi:hypothetical protein
MFSITKSKPENRKICCKMWNELFKSTDMSKHRKTETTSALSWVCDEPATFLCVDTLNLEFMLDDKFYCILNCNVVLLYGYVDGCFVCNVPFWRISHVSKTYTKRFIIHKALFGLGFDTFSFVGCNIYFSLCSLSWHFSSFCFNYYDQINNFQLCLHTFRWD